MGKKRGIINAVFLMLVFAVTFWLVFRGQDMGKIFGYIQNADMRYWLVSMGCVLLFIGGEALNIGYLLRTIGQKARALHCILYAFVGFFFSAITPTSTGGQPAQLYYMRKDQIPTPVATLVLMIITITYKAVLIAVGLAVLIFRPANIESHLGPMLGLCWLGLILNIITVGFIFLLVFHPTMARSLTISLVRLFGKIRMIRKPERYILRVETAMEQYRDVSGYFRANMVVVWKVFVITFVQRFLLFSITYFTFRSFGLHRVDFFAVTLMQAMISVAVDMLPLPGGMGAAENLFLAIFDSLGGGLTLPIMIVSRGLSYYTQLILSALMTVVAHLGIKRREDPV
jgi:uncharacterized protein (TIRG00374 family)